MVTDKTPLFFYPLCWHSAHHLVQAVKVLLIYSFVMGTFLSGQTMHVPLCGAFVNMNSIEAVNESFLCVQTRNVNGMAKKKKNLTIRVNIPQKCLSLILKE